MKEERKDGMNERREKGRMQASKQRRKEGGVRGEHSRRRQDIQAQSVSLSPVNSFRQFFFSFQGSSKQTLQELKRLFEFCQREILCRVNYFVISPTFRTSYNYMMRWSGGG